MNKTLMSLALTTLAASAGALEADTAARDMTIEITREMNRVMAELPRQLALGDQALSFAGRELEGERIVKGAPYCATAVHESIQPLGDGNRIVRKQQSQLCRDSEGRTRREVQREGGPKVIYLNDPVAKESWVIYPDQKRVQRLRGHVLMHSGHDIAMSAWQDSMQEWGERMREQAGRWKEWAGRVAERAKAQDVERIRSGRSGEPGIVIERELVAPAGAASGAGPVERRRELRVIHASEMPMPPQVMAPPVPPVPPAPLMLQLPMQPRSGGVTTALAPKEIDGVKVTGERTTWTLEAGKIGNEKAIVSSREVWRSPELMLTVQSRDADPRSGEQNYRLENIRRGEPDAALMKPPAEFSEAPKRNAKPAASAPTRSS